MFSKNLEWFGKKALESVQHRSIEIMWGTYLSVMWKMDRQLFGEKLYKGTSCISGESEKKDLSNLKRKEDKQVNL